VTPILRRALFAAFLAAILSAPVFSCKYCDAPPLTPPETAQPGEPIDLRSSPGLLPDEISYLQSLERGRFVRRGDYLDDTKAADQSAHLLTNAAAEPILKTHAQGVVADLRERQKSGALQEADRKEALLLYWYRSTLLAPEDQAFLASLNPATFGKVPTRAALGVKPPELAAAGVGAAGSLAQRFMERLSLPGDGAQQAALREAVSLILATPTGRQLAEEFVATGAQARLSFISFSNSQVLEENGKKVLYGTYAVTDSSKDLIEVEMNQDFLKTDRLFYQHHLAPTLAHELLGHGLESVKAKKAGVWQTYNTYYRENETNARLVGWTVEAELGGKLNTPDMFSYLKDPEEYHRSLQVTLPYYSTVMKPVESNDVLATLKARLARAQTALADVPKNIASWESWRPITEHFIAVHKLARDTFRSIVEQIDNMTKKYLPNRVDVLKSIVSHLESAIVGFAGKGGPAAAQTLKTQFGQDFFAQEEARVTARREHLETVAKGRTYEPFSPPPSGQVTWPQLQSMYSQDKKDHADHWKK
jgi:hypothetical protein